MAVQCFRQYHRVRTYVRTCTYVRTYARAYERAYVCACLCMYVRMYAVRMYARAYAPMYVRTYVCTYICMGLEGRASGWAWLLGFPPDLACIRSRSVRASELSERPTTQRGTSLLVGLAGLFSGNGLGNLRPYARSCVRPSGCLFMP